MAQINLAITTTPKDAPVGRYGIFMNSAGQLKFVDSDGNISDFHAADVTAFAIETALGYVPADDAVLTAHISDDVIHVTQSDKDNWNGKADFFDTVDGGDANN